jgi:hypothetical protein
VRNLPPISNSAHHARVTLELRDCREKRAGARPDRILGGGARTGEERARYNSSPGQSAFKKRMS